LPSFKFITLQLLVSLSLLLSLPVFAIDNPSKLNQSFTSASNNHSKTPISVQFNWHHQFQFAGFYAALQQGYYAQAGLDVSVKDWYPGLNPVKNVEQAEVDFAIVYGTAVVDYAKGSPIKLVMSSFQYSPMVLLSHEPITELSQLAEKKIMNYGNLQIETLIQRASTETSKTIHSIPSSGNLQDFISKQVDLYAAYTTNEPFRLKQKGVPFYTLDPKSFGVQSYGDLLITSEKFAVLNPQIVESFKQATIKGWQYAIENQEKIVDYILQHYTVQKDREALLAEARATVPFIKFGQIPIGHVTPSKLKATADNANEVGLLSDIQANSMDIVNFIFDSEKSIFTQQELEYLSSNPVIKLANDIDWEPFEFVDSQKKMQGISAEYLKIIEDKLGVKFEYVTEKTWAQVVEEAKNGERDVYSSAVATEERKKYMNFTEPYLSFPMVLAAKEGNGFIGDYKQLNGQTVSVVKGYWSEEHLQKKYPNINVLSVDSIPEALQAVVDGRATAYSGNLASIVFAIQKYGISGLQIAGHSDNRFELAMGVRKDNPILFSIIEKSLKGITEEQRTKIYNHWINLEVVEKVDQQQLNRIYWIVGSVLGTLLLILLIYRFQTNVKQAYIDQIHELNYACLIDLKTLRMDYVTDSLTRLTGYSKDELLNMSYTDLISSNFPKEKQVELFALMLSGKSWQGEAQGITKSGQPYWVELTLTPQKSLLGGVKKVWATRTDVTDKKRIEKLLILDELTGLYNRRHYNQMIKRETNRYKREGLNFAVAMLDIDYFKLINDHYGHDYGDKVLKELAELIQKRFHRANDYVFRIGGEEFMVLSQFDQPEEFAEYLDGLRQDVQKLGIEIVGSPHKVLTVSIGAVIFNDYHHCNSDQMFKQVDDLLYRAKEKGRNQVIMATNSPSCSS